MQHGELSSDRGFLLVSEFFLQFSLFNINDTFKTGDWLSYIFLKLVYFTNHNCVKRQWDSSTGRSEWDRFPSSTCVKFTCWTERTGRPVDQANQKSKTKEKRRPRFRTGRPVVFWRTGMGARIQRKSRGWWSSWTQRLTRQFFSLTIFRAYAFEKCGFGQTQCSYSLPPRSKLRDLSEDQNYQGSVQKTHWRSRTSCRNFRWRDSIRSKSS